MNVSETAAAREANVPLAFALVIIAGLSTCIGAAVVFVPALVKLANKRVLAGSLGISSGVMLYVSFVEIFVKSLDEFKIVMNHDGHAALVATGTFFGGILFMFGLGQLVACLGHRHDDAGVDDCCDVDKALATPKRTSGGVLVEPTRDPADLKNNPALDMLEEKVASGTALACTGAASEADIESGAATAKSENPQGDPMETTLTEDLSDPSNARKLHHMGLMTALAIGLHNFPEGLATFVGTLDDPSVGIPLAVAIGIHNIPEGICVAIPVYYSTGSRMKGFLWALLSGVSEPVAAVLGYLVLMNVVGPVAYGVLFGMVAGMMVYICLRELIPTAHRYDPEDKVTTYSIIAGMVIMALSLVLFAAEDDAVVSNATAGQAIARAIANVTCVGNECPGK